MSTQRERVDLLEKRLLTTEAARLKAVTDFDRKLHNDLANMNREAVGEIEVNDLRSLVTRWMLQLGKQLNDRCPSCDHQNSIHKPDGCWYTVDVGILDRDLVCVCSVPKLPEASR